MNSAKVVFYRRVSTKKQAKTGFKEQLKSIQRRYPKFTIAHSTSLDVKEVMSGCADLEVRQATGLGKCVRHLKRNPFDIMIVSNADRIARRTDIFKQLQKQNLGDRIFDASTGMSLNDIVKTDTHKKIATQTVTQRQLRRTGTNNYVRNGGVLGFKKIANFSKQGSLKKSQKANFIQTKVISIAKDLAIQARGKRLSHSDICDELDRLGVRTGQNHFFTPKRLSQFIKPKEIREKWDYALDSYRRPRLKIRKLVTSAIKGIMNKWKRRFNIIRLSNNAAFVRVFLNRFRLSELQIKKFTHLNIHDQYMKVYRGDGCRGPPSKVTIWGNKKVFLHIVLQSSSTASFEI